MAGFKKRFKPGSLNFNFEGYTIKDSKGNIKQKATFGREQGQVKVIALGKARDRIRLEDVSTGKKYEMTRFDYESLKEELRKGHFKSTEIFLKAAYWRTSEGHNAKTEIARQNLKDALHSRYAGDVVDPEYEKKWEYIESLIENMDYEQMTQFTLDNERLVREIFDYEYHIDPETYGYDDKTSALTMIQSELEKYFTPEQRYENYKQYRMNNRIKEKLGVLKYV